MARPKKIVTETIGMTEEAMAIQPVVARVGRKDGRIALEKDGGIKLVKNQKQIELLENEGWKRV